MLDWIYILYLFILGATLGSFYNVVGLRLPKGQSFVKSERSACPHCDHTLQWYELIPLFSYLIQRGKCRSCKTPISIQYFLIEVMTGGLFALSGFVFGFDWELLVSLLFVSMAVIIMVSDLAYMLIPNKVLLFFLPLFIGLRVLNPLDPWWSPLLGAVLGGGIILLIIILSRGGMGMGDMKLLAVMGVILGWQHTLITFMLACLIGTIIGVGLILTKKLKRKEPFPFGPSILIAGLIMYYFGEALITWYIGLY